MSLVRFRPEAPSPADFSAGDPKCECSSSGRAPPCQGGGSEFEPRHSLQLRSKELFAPYLIRCHSQVVRQSSAKAPLPSSNLGGTSKKKDTLKSVSFFFGSGGFKAASTLRRLKCSGSAKPPLRNSSLRSQFTPHSRRGPEGPFAYLAAASKVFGQDKKENHPPHHRPCGAGKLSLSSIAMSFQS